MLMGSVFMSALQSEKRVRNELHFFFFSCKRNDILTCKEPSAVHVLDFLCAAHKNRKSQSFGCASFYCWLLDMFFYYNSQRGAFISVMKTSWAIVREESCTSPGGSQVSLQCCRKAFCSASQCELCWGALCFLKEVLSHFLRNVRSVHSNKTNIAS